MKNNIEKLKARAYNKNNTFITRYAAFSELKKLLTLEQFKEIEPEYKIFKLKLYNIFN